MAHNEGNASDDAKKILDEVIKKIDNKGVDLKLVKEKLKEVKRLLGNASDGAKKILDEVIKKIDNKGVDLKCLKEELKEVKRLLGSAPTFGRQPNHKKLIENAKYNGKGRGDSA